MISHRDVVQVAHRPRVRLSLIGLIFALLATGITQAETGVRPGPEAVDRGKQLYNAYCVACHKPMGVGEPIVPWSVRRTDLIEAMPLNETSHAWHHGDDQLIVMILDGTDRSRTRMPVWRNSLSEQNAADLIAYMKSFWSDRIISCQGPRHMDCM